MKAALTAAERGHNVTLFEKTGYLGGQLIHTDYSEFKWPLRNYKDYLVRKLKQSGVELRMNTAPTPEDIECEGFKALIYAAGAIPKLPPILGADGKHIWTALGVYGHEKELGSRVVVVGGSETGVETAAYLAQCGHKVTVLTRGRVLAHDAQPVHYREMFEEFWRELDNFDYHVEVTTESVYDGHVVFAGSDGVRHEIKADDVVLCGGMQPENKAALGFAQVVDYFRMVGDCCRVADVRAGTKAAYTAAMLI